MLELIPDTDPRLHQKCEHVNFRKPGFDVEALAKEMLAVMAANGGVGLAAPQVGITKRLFVLSYEGQTFVCLNPTVISSAKPRSSEEGCLSYPGIRKTITRNRIVKGSFRDETGRARTHTFEGLLACAYLHELDHLNGIVFLDRAE